MLGRIKGVALALAAVGSVLLAQSAHAETATLPETSAVISAVTDKFYPVMIPLMTVGIGIAAVWFVYFSVKSMAKRKG